MKRFAVGSLGHVRRRNPGAIHMDEMLACTWAAARRRALVARPHPKVAKWLEQRWWKLREALHGIDARLGALYLPELFRSGEVPWHLPRFASLLASAIPRRLRRVWLRFLRHRDAATRKAARYKIRAAVFSYYKINRLLAPDGALEVLIGQPSVRPSVLRRLWG